MKNIRKIMNKVDDIIMADLTEKIMLSMAYIGIAVGLVLLIITVIK